MTVVIPKLNKKSYDSPKSFRPIVLLNTISKLIKKVIGERLQFIMVANNFIHSSQLGGLKFQSTTDAGVALIYIIQIGQIKNLTTSILTFDIVQFFPLLNYCLLTLIMKKARFNNHIISFFSNYLVNRKTNYFWNNFTSPIYNINVGVDQGSMLSLILSALYLSPFIYILENCLKNIKILISIISFIDDGLFILQNKFINISNSHLFCSYNILTKLFEKFGLIVKYSKTKIFHFNRSQGVFNSPPLNLTPLKGSILWPNDLWKYLGFIFNRKLTFHQHVDFYANKSISMVKCMKLLGNSNHGINPLQKRLLYRACILSIALYRLQLWFYNHASIIYYLKALGKMQRRVAIQILGAFKTSLSYGIKAIAGLVPIKLYLQKLGGRSQLRTHKLLSKYLICSFINPQSNVHSSQNFIHLDFLTKHQYSLIKISCLLLLSILNFCLDLE